MVPTPASAIRVMLVDDHHTVLWGLHKLIDGEKPRMEVVAKATSGTTALDLARRVNPDVIVLDLDLGGTSSADLIPALVEISAAKVLILTGTRDEKMHEAAIFQGASGLVLKQEPAEVLLKAIDKIHQGELWLDRATTGRIFVELSRRKGDPAHEPQRLLDTLTARERSIVLQLASDPGAGNKKLAKRLHIAEPTLRNHFSRIYDKLGVPNRLELYLYAQRHGLTRDKSA
jgi:two-component system, NarL family, nitrate/nitrite response regulator NarL